MEYCRTCACLEKAAVILLHVALNCQILDKTSYIVGIEV